MKVIPGTFSIIFRFTIALLIIGLIFACNSFPKSQQVTAPFGTSPNRDISRPMSSTDGEFFLTAIFKPGPPPDDQDLSMGGSTNEDAYFDFESGKVMYSPASDIYLGIGCGSGGCNSLLIALDRMNGTMIIEVDDKEKPSLEKCLQLIQQYSGQPRTNSGFPESNTSFCIKTNQGNIARLYVLSNNQDGATAKIKFEYKFWQTNPK